MNDSKKVIFVAMPFGVKRGILDPGRSDSVIEIDFDRVWQKILAPGLPADFLALRSDSSPSSGIIDKIYIEHLLQADVVVADLTFGNPNVYYELGIRHSLCKGGTILVVQTGCALPFDIKKLNVLYYDRSDATSVLDFQNDLKAAIASAIPHRIESPVHIYLPGLYVNKYDPGETPDDIISKLKNEVNRLERAVDDLKSGAEQARLLDQVREIVHPQELITTYHQVRGGKETALRIVEILGIKLRKHGFLNEAVELFTRAREAHPNDAIILRELGFCFRKMGPSRFPEAMECFQIAVLERPYDTELRGMIGGMYKRQGRFEESLAEYREANSIFPNDLYTLVNLGAVSAILERVDEATEHYREVAKISKEKIAQMDSDYWTDICLGEASVYLLKEEEALSAYNSVVRKCPPVEDARSALEQLEHFTNNSSIGGLARKAAKILEDYVNGLNMAKR